MNKEEIKRADNIIGHNVSRSESISLSKKLKQEINTRLWYALGDIEPTEKKMTRAVESIYDLITNLK